MSFLFCCQCPSTTVQTKQNNIKLKKIDHYLYKQVDLLGKGQFSEVYSGMDQRSGQQIAIKVIKVTNVKSKILYSMIQSQINITKELHHPNIVEYYNSFNSPNNCYMIMQNCSQGDLQRYVKVRGGLQQDQIMKIGYDIYKGLQYLASKHIIHRDIKLSNIFLNEDGVAKIGDFGFAIESQGLFKDVSIGSPLYMSPQALIRCQYGPKTDIWSFGIMLYEMIHNQVPYKCSSEQQLKVKILDPPRFKVQTSKDLKILILMCLDSNETTRITIKQLRENAFIKRCRQTIDGNKLKNGNVHNKNGFDRLKNATETVLAKLKPQQLLSLVQYCRLIHKITQKFPSLILSQWLITLSETLTKAGLQAKGEKARKLKDLVRQYHTKYQQQHNVFRMNRTVKDAIQECESLMRSPHKDNCIQFLLQQSKFLKKCLLNQNITQFSKFSRTDHFLKQIES